MPRPLMEGDGKQGWRLDYKQVLSAQEAANLEYRVGMEETEAVMLAMIDKHFARVEKNNGDS